MRPPKNIGIARQTLVPIEYVPYLTSRGVPEGVAYGQFPRSWELLISRIDYDPDKKVGHSISTKKQSQFLTRTIEAPFDKNYLFCISGEAHDNVALQMALQIFVSAMRQSEHTTHKPLWHTVYGFPKDELRDGDPETIGLRIGGRPSLLVISNIAANSTAMKIEKVRDLLTRYSHVPRVIVVGGSNPVAFCSNVLHMAVNRVLFFGFKSEDR